MHDPQYFESKIKALLARVEADLAARKIPFVKVSESYGYTSDERKEFEKQKVLMAGDYRKVPPEELPARAAMLLLLTLARSVDGWNDRWDGPDQLLMFAKRYRVDAKAIQKSVREEFALKKRERIPGTRKLVRGSDVAKKQAMVVHKLHPKRAKKSARQAEAQA